MKWLNFNFIPAGWIGSAVWSSRPFLRNKSHQFKRVVSSLLRKSVCLIKRPVSWSQVVVVSWNKFLLSLFFVVVLIKLTLDVYNIFIEFELKHNGSRYAGDLIEFNVSTSQSVVCWKETWKVHFYACPACQFLGKLSRTEASVIQSLSAQWAISSDADNAEVCLLSTFNILQHSWQNHFHFGSF